MLLFYYFSKTAPLPLILDQHLRFLALTKSKDVRVRSTTNSRMWTPLIYGTKILVFDYYIWKNDIHDQKTVEAFVNNTNLTFLAFLYKLALRCLKKLYYLQWDLNSQNWPSLVYKSDAYPTVLSRHVLKVSDFLILIKSCSIESRNDSSPKSEVVHETKFSLKISYSTHACLAQLEMSDLCYLRKPRVFDSARKSSYNKDNYTRFMRTTFKIIISQALVKKITNKSRNCVKKSRLTVCIDNFLS